MRREQLQDLAQPRAAVAASRLPHARQLGRRRQQVARALDELVLLRRGEAGELQRLLGDRGLALGTILSSPCTCMAKIGSAAITTRRNRRTLSFIDVACLRRRAALPGAGRAAVFASIGAAAQSLTADTPAAGRVAGAAQRRQRRRSATETAEAIGPPVADIGLKRAAPVGWATPCGCAALGARPSPVEDGAMTPEQVRLVRASFAGVVALGDQAAALFYAAPVRARPDAASPCSRATSRPSARSSWRARDGGGALDRPDEMLPAVRALGRRHARYGVAAEHYATVGERADLDPRAGPRRRLHAGGAATPGARPTACSPGP